MRIAIMGTGGVGGYFGARLATAGHDVSFIARGRHLAAIRANGLRVNSPNGDRHVEPADATDDPAAIGPVDLVLFTVKLWDVESAAEACRPLIGADTAVIPFQNGVESLDVLAGALGADHVVGGVAYIAAVIGEPGLIVHTGKMAKLVFGELDGSASPRTDALLAACGDAGIEAVRATDIRRALWEKFVFLSAFSGVTTASRSSIGPVRADPHLRGALEAAMAETATVGRALGIGLGDAIVAERMAFVDGLPPEMKSSMQQDLENGRRLEAAWLSGGVGRLGRRAGVPTPVHDTLHAVLRPFVDGTP